ncbi:MAG: acyl-CoA dehydrogenase, partial [Proteobacteria bacterium]|nr:acyl-CoA dehydrogenase [Pseudomonadota bacterium]
AAPALHGEDGLYDTAVTFENECLNGTAWFVQDLQKVDFLVVAARQGEHLALCCVSLNAEGVEIHADKIVDLTRDQGRVTFTNVNAVCVAREADPVLARALPAITTLVAADIAGACEWLMQATAEYAKVRTQFDRPIGFFQAVKHPIVNMMIMADETRSLVYSAACAYDTEPETAELSAHLAKSSASDTAVFCANRATQLHGGIGFTWEHDVQIYHKRVMHAQQLYGDGIYHREQAALHL